MSRQTTTRRRHGVRRMSERKRLTITAISAVLALVTVVICALTGVFNFHKGNERILPNLVGQTEESAKAQLAELDAYLQRVEIAVSCSHSPCQLDIDLRGSCGSHTARVRITNQFES